MHNSGGSSQSEGPAPSPSRESAVVWDTADVRSAPEANRPNFCNPGAPSQLEGSLPGPSHQPAVVQDTVGVGLTPESSLFFQCSPSVAHSWIMAKYELALDFGSPLASPNSIPDKAIGPWEFTAHQNV